MRKRTRKCSSLCDGFFNYLKPELLQASYNSVESPVAELLWAPPPPLSLRLTEAPPSQDTNTAPHLVTTPGKRGGRDREWGNATRRFSHASCDVRCFVPAHISLTMPAVREVGLPETEEDQILWISLQLSRPHSVDRVKGRYSGADRQGWNPDTVFCWLCDPGASSSGSPHLSFFICESKIL